MQNKKVTLFIIAAFIIGIFIVVYIEYNSSKSIDNLVTGNETLLKELKIANDINQLEKDIVTVESKVRGAIATNDKTYLNGINTYFDEILEKTGKLLKTFSSDSSLGDIKKLNDLVHKKIRYNQQLLDSLNLSGKQAAENLIATQTGKKLSDSIFSITSKINKTRQNSITEAITYIDKNSQKAQEFSSILIAIVLAGGVILFWFIINIIRKQITLIKNLNASEKMVKETARIKENFMANMSHEIRTPMNAILGFTYLLQKKNLDSESREYIDTIHRSGENLLTIINDVLDLSKIESGMMRIEETTFGLRELLHSIEIMFRPKVHEKGLSLNVSVDESVPEMLIGDATRLTQILINLIGNALKFTTKGSISIKIENNGLTETGIKLGIAVADTGIGIEKEKQKTIFNRFQQADDSITRNFGGTGLGLSIVKELVELQNGTIEVKSSPDMGTAFQLMIPYRISSEHPSYTTENTPHNKLNHNFGHTRILVVEDNEINQKLVKHLFTQWGLEYDLAQNGLEAIGKLESRNYSLILMDIQMPIMDGYTATQMIRNKLGSNIPIIAMTAHALAGEREKCIGYGMNDYISKPLRETTLHALISRYTSASLNETLTTSTGRENKSFHYQHINLAYMKEISNGNVEYEKEVTQQFIEAIPEDLKAIETAWQTKDITAIRQVVHNMKTTVSVLGIGEPLQTHLNTLEYQDLTEETYSLHNQAIKDICTASVTEAKQFLSTL